MTADPAGDAVNEDAQQRPQTFALHRDHDVSGVSGPGHVADGVVWCDGSVSVRWRGDHPSVAFWQRMESVEAVHGHGGATRVVFDAEAEHVPAKGGGSS